MDVSTIEISKEEALRKIEDYQFLNERQRTREDERLLALYRSVKNGARILNLNEVFKQTGLNEKGQPKLAIARADWHDVYFHPKCNIWWVDETHYNYSNWNDGSGCFTDAERFNSQSYGKTISLPVRTFDDNQLSKRKLKSRVPHVPPFLRPKNHLRNYHILFEVENWEEYPVDPFLLKRLNDNLFVVLGEWELTKLEASLLSSMR